MKKYFWLVIVILLTVILLLGCQGEDNQQEKAVQKEINDTVEVGDKTSEEVRVNKSLTAENRGEIEGDKEEIITDGNYYLSPFTGKYLNEKLVSRAVMVSVENTDAARPQSGLEDADIIYEFLVEGGITRFLPLYWNKIPDKIGPVRSLRPYLIETALSYDALLLHAGASPEGFAMLSEVGIDNLDQIYNGSYYWRDGSRKRPHNLYTGYFKLENYLNKLTGFEYEQRFSFQQIQLLLPGDTKAEKISIDYWGDYRVLYKYSPGENKYKRFLYEIDRPHLTENGTQLTAKNVVVQYVETEVKDDIGRLEMKLYGTGKALIFKDGTVVKGYWQADKYGVTKYYNSEDKEVKLNPGQTWIQVVPTSTDVKYESGDSSG